MKFDPLKIKGTREEIVKELRSAEVGWQHQGKPSLAVEAAEGASRLEAGESSARVGHVTYVVTD